MYTRDIISTLCSVAREIGLQIRRRERARRGVCGVQKPVRTAIRLGVKRSGTLVQWQALGQGVERGWVGGGASGQKGWVCGRTRNWVEGLPRLFQPLSPRVPLFRLNHHCRHWELLFFPRIQPSSIGQPTIPHTYYSAAPFVLSSSLVPLRWPNLSPFLFRLHLRWQPARGTS